ncbi:hypothetical protein EVAR_34563_1 [Eumeta japonica]|uniref:Craniofacial development protein 2 n=1 Tax=Eumeta variegata TaxID=151549 RepID=A0A4C1X5W9_EUMVA|nr:hypothetical protein EVAR_34563_1 [Eumeta japonica]
MSKPLEKGEELLVKEVLVKCDRNKRIVILGDFNGWVERDLQRDRYKKILDQIMEALKRTQVEKAAGYDRVASEMLRSGGSIVASLLYQVFNNCLKDLRAPNDRYKVVIVSLYKGKGSRQLPSQGARVDGAGASGTAGRTPPGNVAHVHIYLAAFTTFSLEKRDSTKDILNIAIQSRNCIISNSSIPKTNNGELARDRTFTRMTSPQSFPRARWDLMIVSPMINPY